MERDLARRMTRCAGIDVSARGNKCLFSSSTFPEKKCRCEGRYGIRLNRGKGVRDFVVLRSMEIDVGSNTRVFGRSL